jgi:hypothetical protein
MPASRDGLGRRDLLTAAVLTAGVAVAGAASAEAQTPKSGFSPMPLPFDPKSIPGLSEKLLVSHHDNLHRRGKASGGDYRPDVGSRSHQRSGVRMERPQARRTRRVEFDDPA